MLRLFVLLLLLLNALYFAWSQGMLRAYGWAPVVQTESQRLQQQVKPEAVRFLSVEDLRRMEQAARTPPKPPECLQAGLFEEGESAALRAALESKLPAGSWVLEPVVEPARWIVYMGKYSSEATLARKRAELLKLKVKLYPLKNPDLAHGLSLGGFDTQAKAKAELNALQRRGVRTAKVVLEHPEMTRNLLRVPAADEALRPRLEALKPALGDKPLRACTK